MTVAGHNIEFDRAKIVAHTLKFVIGVDVSDDEAAESISADNVT